MPLKTSAPTAIGFPGGLEMILTGTLLQLPDHCSVTDHTVLPALPLESVPCSLAVIAKLML